MNRPFKWLTSPILAFEWRNMSRLYKLFAAPITEEVGQFDLDVYDLGIKRLHQFRSLFLQVQERIREPRTLIMVDALVKTATRGIGEPEGMRPFAELYVQNINEITTASIEKFDQLIAEIPNREAIKNFGQLRNWFSYVRFEASGIIGTRESLFMANWWVSPYLVRVKGPDGQEKTGNLAPELFAQPEHVLIALVPFNAILLELVKSAESLEGSIANWESFRLQQRARFMDFRVAHVQHRLAWALNIFQILVILFAFGLSAFFFLAEDPWDLRKENKELKTQLEVARNELETAKKSTAPKTGSSARAR